MIKLSVMVITNRVNNKWIQSIEVYEGKLRSFDCQFGHEDGNNVTTELIDEFEYLYPSLSILSEKIIETLNFSREKFLMKGRIVYNLAAEHDVSKNQLQNHICCNGEIDKSGVVTRKDVKLNGIPNCDMKYHFKRFDKTSHSMGYFNNNKCPVCMATYKEILENDRHIVIPKCGHPICCKCCDETLRIKPNCPLGREDMDIWKKGEFVVMKFDTNLQPLPQERRIYY